MAENGTKKILECLQRAYPKDMTIEEIADKTGIHRNTVSKYVYALEKNGTILRTRKVGSAKLYTVKAKG